MIITTPKQLSDFLQDFNYLRFSFDTETNGLDWFALNIKGLSLYDGKESCYIYFTDEWSNSLWSILFGLFESAKIIVGHNLVFDFKVLKKYINTDSILINSQLIDTMMAEYIINSENPRGLKGLTRKYFNESRLTWKEVEHFGYDSEEMAKYCIQDSIDSWNLWAVQKPILEANNQLSVFEIDCSFIPVQIEMETTGILIDKELLKKQEEHLELMKCQLEEEMCKTVGLDFYYQGELFGGKTIDLPLNFGSPKAVSQMVQNRLKIPLKLNKKTGNYSVGRKTLDQLKDAHPFFPLYLKYQAVKKLLTGYVRPYWELIKPDGKLYPSFRHQRSGRCGSYNPNLQQLAKYNDLVPDVNIRSLFVFGD